MSLFSSCLVATAGRTHWLTRSLHDIGSSGWMPNVYRLLDLRGDDSDCGCRPLADRRHTSNGLDYLALARRSLHPRGELRARPLPVRDRRAHHRERPGVMSISPAEIFRGVGAPDRRRPRALLRVYDASKRKLPGRTRINRLCMGRATRVALVPGAAGSAAFWTPITERLPDDWIVTAIDLPGLGSVPARMTSAAMTTWPSTSQESSQHQAPSWRNPWGHMWR